MKINIFDAAIRRRAGHHYDYGLKMLRHYAEAGHDVHVYGFAQMDEVVVSDFRRFGEVSRLFRTFPYLAASRYDPFAGELVRFRAESISITADLRQARPADVWIWPTMRPAEIEACATLASGVPVVGCVYWDPGFEAASMEAQLWRYALLFAEAEGLALTLASVEAELRHRFMPVLPSGRFVIVPQPVDGPPIEEPKTALRRIGFFGHQRQEKGAGLMEALLPQLVKDGYAITYHDSAQDGWKSELPGVDRLEYLDNIAVAIADCDLVVLPYDVVKYRARGSGILMECLALGVPVAAPVGTLPGRIIERVGAGPLFLASSVKPIYQAIKVAERNYAAFARKSHQAAKSFCSRNGAGLFASALLAAARTHP